MASTCAPTGRPVASREDAVAWAKRAARKDFELLRLLSKQPVLLRVAVSAGFLGTNNCSYNGEGGKPRAGEDGASRPKGRLAGRRKQRRRRRETPKQSGAPPEKAPVAPGGTARTHKTSAGGASDHHGAAESRPRRRRTKSAARRTKDAAKLEEKWRARRRLQQGAHGAEGEAAAEATAADAAMDVVDGSGEERLTGRRPRESPAGRRFEDPNAMTDDEVEARVAAAEAAAQEACEGAAAQAVMALEHASKVFKAVSPIGYKYSLYDGG
jgi:hypothetical protein